MYDEFKIDFGYKDIFKVKSAVLISGIYDLDGIMDLKFPGMFGFLMALTGLNTNKLNAFLNSERVKTLSPINYVDDRYPPTAVIMSKRDNLTPNSIDLCKKLAENHVHYTEYTCTGISSVHAGGICTKTKSGAESLRKTMDFVLDNLHLDKPSC